MSKFKEKFIRYSDYINNNGNDIDYIENCVKYRNDYIASLGDSDFSELECLIKNHQFAIHMEDGFELYRRYFESGGRKKDIFNAFYEYLWFWGDYDDFIPILKDYIERGEEKKLDIMARRVVEEGLDSLKRI